MLKSENIFVKTNSMKNTTFDALSYVTAIIRHTELSKAQDKKIYKDGKKVLEESHADIDVLTCEEKIINEELKNDAGEFIKARDEVALLTEECKSCLSMEEFTALDQTDRVHIILMAHACYSGVLLPVSLFDADNGGTDLSNFINEYYKSMKINANLKSQMCAIINEIAGTEGTNFYGFRPKKSNIEKSDLAHFLARFSGHAKRDKKTVMKKVTWSDFKYQTRTDMVNQQKAFTELLAVILDNTSKHEVIKPEEKAEAVAEA